MGGGAIIRGRRLIEGQLLFEENKVSNQDHSVTPFDAASIAAPGWIEFRMNHIFTNTVCKKASKISPKAHLTTVREENVVERLAVGTWWSGIPLTAP